jgi:hypothetical protein
MPAKLISAEVTPLPNKATQAAQALQRLGFRILHIGPTISVQGSRSLWKSTFHVSFKSHKKTTLAEAEVKTTYPKAQFEVTQIPSELKTLISDIAFVEPPEFLGKS